MSWRGWATFWTSSRRTSPGPKACAAPADHRLVRRYGAPLHQVPHPRRARHEGLLEHNSSGVFWRIMRCEKLGPHNYSLHADGRVIDWHLDVHTAAGRKEAKRLISLFLAPDQLGNEHALARRMGIQELIWNCTAWWSGPGGMEKYSVCYDKNGHRLHIDDTTAHRNHIHIGLNRLGARKLTSFWTHR